MSGWHARNPFYYKPSCVSIPLLVGIISGKSTVRESTMLQMQGIPYPGGVSCFFTKSLFLQKKECFLDFLKKYLLNIHCIIYAAPQHHFGNDLFVELLEIYHNRLVYLLLISTLLHQTYQRWRWRSWGNCTSNRPWFLWGVHLICKQPSTPFSDDTWSSFGCCCKQDSIWSQVSVCSLQRQLF